MLFKTAKFMNDKKVKNDVKCLIFYVKKNKCCCTDKFKC